MTRRVLYREIKTYELTDYTLDFLLDELLGFKAQYPNTDIRVEFSSVYDSYSGPDEMAIFYTSPETDEEYNTRLAVEADELETKERKELGRLVSAKKLNPNNQLRLRELLEKYPLLGE